MQPSSPFFKSLRLSLWAAWVCLAGTAAPLAAANSSIVLHGTVPVNIAVSIAPAANYNNLDLEVNAVNTLLATITEVANTKLGYTVVLESNNAIAAGQNTAYFKNTADATETLNYTLKYNGVTVAFGTGGGIGKALVSNANAKTPAGGTSKGLQITYNGSHANLEDGIYQDTLRVTIAAK